MLCLLASFGRQIVDEPPIVRLELLDEGLGSTDGALRRCDDEANFREAEMTASPARSPIALRSFAGITTRPPELTCAVWVVSYQGFPLVPYLKNMAQIACSSIALPGTIASVEAVVATVQGAPSAEAAARSGAGTGRRIRDARYTGAHPKPREDRVDPTADSRFISRLTRDTLALILAGGQGTRLHELTAWRAKPAVPFGGKFRLVDFPLSNCVNSGIRRIGVLTQYKAHSLIRHLVRGWNIFKGELGEFIEVLPASQRVGGEWYLGTADAVYQNLDIIRSLWPEYVLILGGDHVYKMDYGQMLAAHVEAEADLTVGCLEVPVEEAAGSYGVCVVDADHRIREFQEKPEQPTPLPGRPGACLASMGIYVFNTRFLYERLNADADDPRSRHDFGGDVVPGAIGRYRVLAFPFRDPSGEQAYWRDVGTLDSFYAANLELVDVLPELDLYDRSWPILTYQEQLPPAKFVFDDDGRRGHAVDSMVSGGCIISGATLRRSLLFSNVRVEVGSDVEDTVVLPDCSIGPGARIRRAIIDRGCSVAPGTRIGIDADEDDARGFRVSESGVVLVTPGMLGQAVHFVR